MVKKIPSKKPLKGLKKISKKIKAKENQQILMFLVVVGVAFASFLVPYFLIENAKVFEFANIEWVVEDYDTFTAYHGRFPKLDASLSFHNIWLRNDPRELEVPSDGEFNRFRYGGVVAFDKVVGECIGEITRVSIDLVSFVKDGIGVGNVEIGTTDMEVAEATDRVLVNCQDTYGRTVVILKDGKTSMYQNGINKNCYTINVETCDDIRGVEAFMVKVLNDTLVPEEEEA